MNRIKQLKAILAETPNDDFALYGLGMEYKGQQDWDSAIAYFGRVVALNALHAAAWFQLGQIYAELERYDEAENAYEQGVQAASQIGNNKLKQEIESYWNAL